MSPLCRLSLSMCATARWTLAPSQSHVSAACFSSLPLTSAWGLAVSPSRLFPNLSQSATARWTPVHSRSHVSATHFPLSHSPPRGAQPSAPHGFPQSLPMRLYCSGRRHRFRPPRRSKNLQKGRVVLGRPTPPLLPDCQWSSLCAAITRWPRVPQGAEIVSCAMPPQCSTGRLPHLGIVGLPLPLSAKRLKPGVSRQATLHAHHAALPSLHRDARAEQRTSKPHPDSRVPCRLCVCRCAGTVRRCARRHVQPPPRHMCFT
jgi:hypothetical protein